MTDQGFNPFSLDGKKILVTGASSGIGRATAIECSRLGAEIIAVGRNEQRLAETMVMLGGENHGVVNCDLCNDSQLESLIDSVPKLDGVVLAAGIVEMRPFMFASQDKYEEIFKTNLFSPLQFIRLLIKKKKFNKGFSIVAISSVAGKEDFVPGNCIYGSGKAALSSALRYAALELAPKQIRINTVSPGMILTPMHTEGDVTEEQLSAFVSKLPIARWGMPEEVAHAAVYLLSDASAYMTGSDIRIDGGLTI